MRRGGKAAYGYAKFFPPAGLAWEYLRRHEDYHHDFQAITGMREPEAARLESFANRWGVLFPM
ncbi:transcriptional regulator domain-containing protein [Pseudogemmobacter sonorensis]|uniref:transcriptional regulator domain-containing protein n=1 Tax=Pseudogemmobacter sonorensis TaxID=2989681 RepID=UPI003F67492E